mgnify:CR=1 FL=1
MNTELLREGIRELGIEVDKSRLGQIAVYLREIELWNSRVNLVGASGDDLIIRHVLDSLAGLPVISALRPLKLLDAGTGGGFPGIVLALFLKEAKITLLDRSAKKCAFLNNVRALINLDNCSVINHELSSETEMYDVICCRAFRPLEAVFDELAACRNSGGTLVLYKGKKQAIEVEVTALGNRPAAAGLQPDIIPLRVPNLREERHLLLFRETSL